jgi:uncharacterized RDD family membrane protein YckC
LDSAPNFRTEYHPLAERALEKVNRARIKKTDPPDSVPPYSSLPAPETARQPSPDSPPLSIRRGKRPTGPDKGKIERIEINLNQGVLPFEAGESESAASAEDQIESGLEAAALAPRMLAGGIDGLFVAGCFLIFLGIVFFVPDFAFLTKSSFLGLTLVWALILAAYLFIFIASGAQTLGMEYESLRVVAFNGKSPSLRETALRLFGYFASLGCFALGFIWAYFDPDRLTWHDRISRTLIVQK